MFFQPVWICLAALALAGCAQGSAGDTPTLFGGTPSRPKTVLVSDFVWSSEVAAIDRGFTARLDRKIGSYPTFERKTRTIARINDEIVATITATLREAGLEAQPGDEDALSLADSVMVVKGALRASDGNARSEQSGFGNGRGGVTADMTVIYASGAGKKPLLTFAAEGSGARKARRTTSGKTTATYNAAIAAALVAEKADPEKLSPDVEEQARRIGRAVGEKIVAYAKEQGWLEKPEGAGTAVEEKPVRMQPPKSGTKPGMSVI
jgi:hypothetical protein